MKNLVTLLVAFFLLTNASFATVRTVSNHSLGGAQYGSLQSAYNSSNPGDTLLIEGTDAPYSMDCGQPFNKKLTLIGIGFNPNKQIPKRTKIRYTDCWGELRILGGASGSSFYGIEFTSHVWSQDQALSNMIFEDCKFNTHFNFSCGPANNFAFRNCIFDGDNQMNLNFGGCSATATGIVSNCVFDGYIEGNGSPFTSVTIDHCLFLKSDGSFNNLYYAQIRNSIFMNAAPISPTGSYFCNYDNNLCRIATTFPPYPGNGNTGSNNITSTNPNFVSYALGALYSPAQDYHLQAGSAAIGAANDLTDIGVHGGFTGFSELGETLINPIIRAMTILNTSVASNGTLSVQVHATKPDND
jgi:hypothetical protein